MGNAPARRTAEWADILADADRSRLYSAIAAGDEVPAIDLTRSLDMSPGTVSLHLETLVRAGLVDRCERGSRIAYGLSVPAGRALVLGLLPATRLAA